MTIRGIADAWVGNELRIVLRDGIPCKLHALGRSDQNYFSSDDIAQMGRETHFIYPLPRLATAFNVLAAPFRFKMRFFTALWNALSGERESLRIRAVGLWHFVVACHWAAHLRHEDVSHIHSQWIHSAGTVAMYGAWLTDTSFSFTGHAADLFRERCALRDKIARADFIICISEFHRQFYLDHGADPAKLHVVYCGIDTSHFTPRRRVRPKGAPLQIRSAGRLVDKKGFADLIEACGLLAKRGVAFHCTIGGSGPLEADLRAKIANAGLSDHIEMTGTALKQEDIPDFMYGGDLFCLPCVWAEDNDVDGLPQLSMEAMACGLPVITTDLVGNPDLVIDGTTGLLVPPGDAAALADAIQRLDGDEPLAQKLAQSGHVHVRETFDINTCLEPLLDKYRTALETSR
ncbi:glycosyltransferase family 4 protein [Octadecabacter sp. 1_MG-2023]|uniref:glycosyltransferase family 4 protein n=1 Tax=unclassified Octadecabacter TaxID=196158 RepID=UPI002090B746|nr:MULTISPECIES: glycosyltransferase family 4 protein [unclassified Octadecabacter]MDO6736082.1 glycosyltransferase family 4 protein [Octadecabacter sp. 1_MG-2023]